MDRKEKQMQSETYSFHKGNKKTCYQKVKKYIKGYCENSSIQGLNYLIRDISCCERIWWLIVLFFCLAGCVYMIGEIYTKWFESPVIVAFSTKEMSVKDIPFPAITICPETKISVFGFNRTEILLKKKRKEEVSEEENLYFDYMNLICLPEYDDIHSVQPNNSVKYNASDVYDFFTDNAAIDENNWVTTFRNDADDVEGIMSPLMTDVGLCFTFNMLDRKEILSDDVIHYSNFMKNPKSNWNVEIGYRDSSEDHLYPRRTMGAGVSNGLWFMLYTNKDDEIYGCNLIEFQGFRVSLHLPSRLPLAQEDFFIVSQGQHVIASVEPEMMTTSAKVKNYGVKVRSCYFMGEKKLKYFKMYSQTNCVIECRTNYTLELCGCVDLYMPRTSNDTLICGPNRCLQEARDISTTKSFEEIERKCDCKPLCNDITYKYRLTNTNINFYRGASLTFDAPIENFDVASMNIFFKSSQFLPTRKDELYGVTDFISNFGGILGLFTGFSLFSVAEIIYFLTVRIVENRRRHRDWSGPEE